MTQPYPPAETCENCAAYSISRWERAGVVTAFLVAVLVVVSIVSAVIFYNLRGQHYKHEEKLRIECIKDLGKWIDGDCRYPQFEG